MTEYALAGRSYWISAYRTMLRAPAQRPSHSLLSLLDPHHLITYSWDNERKGKMSCPMSHILEGPTWKPRAVNFG